MPEPVAARIPRTRRRPRWRTNSVRRTARVAAIAAAATVLLLIAGLLAWRSYSEWQLGRIVLTNDGPPMTVQVLDEPGREPIGEPVEVFKKSTLALPDGDYRLQVNQEGRLGRTYRLAVNRGETIAHELSLDEGRLLRRDLDLFLRALGDPPREEPMPFALVTAALELTPGKADIVEFTGRTVIRRDGTTGEPIWDAASPRSPHDPGRDPALWLRRIIPGRVRLSFFEPAMDLDGDGIRDVLAVLDASPAFLALSGKDGSMLWNHVPAHDGPGGPQPEGPLLPGPVRPASREGRLLGRPTVGDVDADGVPDLIATMSFQEFPEEAAQRSGNSPTNRRRNFTRRVVHAISGRSGRSLWSYPIDPNFTNITIEYWNQPAVLTRGRRSSAVAIVDDSRWIGLDPATGRPEGSPIDLGFEPVRPLQYADLDGDGEPEIVALGPGSGPKQQILSPFSISAGRPLWTATVGAAYASRFHGEPTHEWPWLVDLDGDGRTEVIVPDSGMMPPKAGFLGLKVLDGPSGRTRWVRPMNPQTKANDGLDHVVEAPDLDGDGVCDLIAASHFDGHDPPTSPREKRSEPARAFADALSGRDGRLLWSWHADLAERKVGYVWSPRWWGRGPDGWPMLAVPLGGQNPDQPGMMGPASWFHPPAVYVLEASTGLERNRAEGLRRPGVADLDGDGLTDLWGEAEGQLRAFRGEPPEAWRTLNFFHPAGKEHSPWDKSHNRPAADLDGDGIADVLSGNLYDLVDAEIEPRGSLIAIARSGRDGHLLWKSVLDPPGLWFHRRDRRSYTLSASAPPAGDLDGDGTPDILVANTTNDEAAIDRQPTTLPLQALSGRDGRPLWSAGPLPLGYEAHGFTRMIGFDPHVLKPGDPPDLLVRHRNPFLKVTSNPTSSSLWPPAQERLARVSGRSGRVLWDIAVEEHITEQELSATPRVADLDGDGRPDAVVFVNRASRDDRARCELRAVSLRDGAGLWSRVVDYQTYYGMEMPDFEIGEGGMNEPATVYVTDQPASNELLVHELDGRDGTIRWTWRSGLCEGENKVYGRIDPIGLEGHGKDSICVTCEDLRGECRIVILDSSGRERARRVISRPTPPFTGVSDVILDLDGDGRDELLVWHDGRLGAWGRDLKERWSIPARACPSTWIPPSSPGRPATLILHPATGIDGASGQTRWQYRSSPGVELLDPGDSDRLPLLVSTRNGPIFCQQPLPVTTRGDDKPPVGALVPPGLVPDDPRWTRPLPWTGPVGRIIAPPVASGAIGLALVNVMLPIALLRMAARRRPWTIRLLLMLPVAAAVPLSTYLAVEPLLPAKLDPLPPYPRLLFVLATVAGVPAVAWMALAGWSLVRLRWTSLAGLAGLTLLASAAIAAAWMHSDGRSMPAIEHYGRSGWYLVVVPGAYAAGVLIVIARPLRRAYRWMKHPRPTETGIPPTSPERR